MLTDTKKKKKGWMIIPHDLRPESVCVEYFLFLLDKVTSASFIFYAAQVWKHTTRHVVVAKIYVVKY